MAKNLKNDDLGNVSGGYLIKENRKTKKYTDPATNTTAHKYVKQYTVLGHQNGNYVSKTFDNRNAAVTWADNNLDY